MRTIATLLFLLALRLCCAVDYDWCLRQAVANSSDLARTQTDLAINAIEFSQSRFSLVPGLYTTGGLTQESYGNRYLTGSVGLSNSYSLSNPIFLDWREYKLQDRYLRRSIQKEQAVLELSVLNGYHACLTAQLEHEQAIADTLYWSAQWRSCTSSPETHQLLFISLLEARINCEQTKSHLFDAMADLQDLLGESLPDSAFVAPQVDLTLAMPTEADYRAQLYRQHYSLASDKLNLLRGKLALLPDLTLSAYYVSSTQNWLRDADRLYDYEGNYINRDSHETYWYLYAGFSWTLQNIFDAWQDARIARLELRRCENEIVTEKRRLMLEAEKLGVQVESLTQQVQSAEEKAQACRQLTELVELRWAGGRADFDELYAARQRSSNAAIELLRLQCSLREALLTYRTSLLE